MDDHQFQQLLDRFQYSWSGYRKVRKGVKKRISRHMSALDCSTIQDYLDLLSENDQVREECERRMTVPISRFFRDRQLWLGLEEEILPSIIEDKHNALKVWSAGCARGEEVYSFNIVWDRLKKVYDHLPELVILATDLNAELIEQAKVGIYNYSSLKEIPETIQKVYFEKKKKGNLFEVKGFLKENIQWKAQSFLTEPPGFNFDIIFLRNNLLTYHLDPLRKERVMAIINSLKPYGWLIIGVDEKLPEGIPDLIQHPKVPSAFRRIAPAY